MSSPSNRASAVVIGAGIVGAACAHRLQTLGFDVVLVDRDLPGEACSFGNAGRIATSLVTPKSVPGLLRKVPGMLRDHRHPLKTSLGFVLRNLRWCIRFARAGAPGEVARITDALHVLLSRGDAAIDRLASAAGAMEVIQTDGVFYVYQDLALAEAARDTMAESNRRGTPAHYVTGDQIRDIDPAVPASVTCGFHKPEERFVRSPLELTRKVVGAFAAAGGAIVRDEVVRLETRAGLSPRVHCRNESYEADKVVIAAGAWSPGLAAQLGIGILIIPERGYHAMLPRAGVGLNTAIHYGDRLISIHADDRRASGFERRGARGRGRGAGLGPPRCDHRGGEDALSGPRRLRGDPVDGPSPLDPGHPANHRRASGALRRPVRHRARHARTHPVGDHPRRSSATSPRDGFPTSTSHPIGRAVSDAWSGSAAVRLFAAADHGE